MRRCHYWGMAGTLREQSSNNLLLRAVTDKVHAPDCCGNFKVGGFAPHVGRAAAEQGRYTARIDCSGSKDALLGLYRHIWRRTVAVKT